MDTVARVELEYSYVAGDGWTRSRVVSMPKKRSGGPWLDQSCNWEKYGYDNHHHHLSLATSTAVDNHHHDHH